MAARVATTAASRISFEPFSLKVDNVSCAFSMQKELALEKRWVRKFRCVTWVGIFVLASEENSSSGTYKNHGSGSRSFPQDE